MKKKKKNNDLFLLMAAGLFVEAFLLFDRWSGGGFLAFFGAVAVPVVFTVLIISYNNLSNEKLKKGFGFGFAGFLLLSAYIMWGIMGGLLGIMLGIMLAGIIFAGTMSKLSKPKAEKRKTALTAPTSAERTRGTEEIESKVVPSKETESRKTFGAEN